MNYFIGIYEGEFKNGIKEGKGKFIYNNKEIYDGEWENDIKKGKGKFIYDIIIYIMVNGKII